MWRDMERRCEKYGLELNRPSKDSPRTFPQNSVAAARTAIIALKHGWGKTFCKSVYVAQFAEGRDISDPAVIADLIAAAGQVPDAVLADAQTRKSALRANVEDAQALGIYGAPSFTVEDELFWGDDRLEDALDWASKNQN